MNNGFRPELNEAFRKMIKGINVFASESAIGECPYLKDVPGFITAIHEDESISITFSVKDGRYDAERVKLTFINL